jgi:signal transduction histidine kinase
METREMLGVCSKPEAARVPGRQAGRADGCPGPEGWGSGRSDGEWLAILAHELRSPLVTVLYALEVIAGGDELDPAARRARDVAERQAQRAVRLVDDLFDLCAGSLGRMNLRTEVVELAGIVAGAAEAAGHLIAARRHRLTVSLPPEPVTLRADPVRLEQVLTNLLANAAKFTDPGGDIRLTAHAQAGQVVLRVQDNGRGIAPDLLPRVFDLFWQDPGRGDARGLGLGLALVKSLIERHGGSVAAHSDGPGAGAEFVVHLPACSRDRRTSPPPCPPDSP